MSEDLKNKKLFDALVHSKEEVAADAISAWTRAQLRGDYGNYPFTGGKIRGITRTLFDPVFYEILEQRLTREDRARRLELRLVGRKEWYEYSHDLREHKHHGWNTEEFERPWFEAFGELSAVILAVAAKNSNMVKDRIERMLKVEVFLGVVPGHKP